MPLSVATAGKRGSRPMLKIPDPSPKAPASMYRNAVSLLSALGISCTGGMGETITVTLVTLDHAPRRKTNLYADYLIISLSHSVARCEPLRAARDGLSVPWREEPGASRARGQVSRGELRRSVMTVMMPRSLRYCCVRERQREHCRCTWQEPFVRHGGPPFDGYETRELFGVLFNLVVGDRVPGSLIHLALQCGVTSGCARHSVRQSLQISGVCGRL